MAESETWRNQRERRYQLGRAEAAAILEVLANELPQPSYTEGSTRTLVVTTYLDSPARDYLRMVDESGGRISLKMRLREYLAMLGDGEEAQLTALPSCFLERKERTGDVRQKHRVRLDKLEVGAVLRGDVPLAGRPDVVAALEAELAHRSLGPVMVSAYERHVFGSDGTGLRVTFDERLRFYHPPPELYDRHPALTPEILGDAMAPGPGRILELKEPDGSVTPAWLERLLGQVVAIDDYSKFRDGMNALSDQGQRRPLTRPLHALK